MNMFLVALLVGAAITPLLALEVPLELSWDGCEDLRTVLNFKPEKFDGVWYDVQRYKNAVFNGDCATATFSWDSNNERFNLSYSSLESLEEFELRPQDLSNGELVLYRRGRRTPLVLHILDTDYVNYAVIWSCTDIMYGVGSAQTLSIYSRARSLEPALIATARNTITSRNLNDNHLERVIQDRSTCRRRGNYK